MLQGVAPTVTSVWRQQPFELGEDKRMTPETDAEDREMQVGCKGCEHFERNVLSHAPSSSMAEVPQDLKAVFKVRREKTAKALAEEFVERNLAIDALEATEKPNPQYPRH